MIFIPYIMYDLCAGYETGILDYVFHVLIMGIMDLFLDHFGNCHRNNTYFIHSTTISGP
jgi:hypothetical protein